MRLTDLFVPHMKRARVRTEPRPDFAERSGRPALRINRRSARIAKQTFREIWV